MKSELISRAYLVSRTQYSRDAAVTQSYTLPILGINLSQEPQLVQSQQTAYLHLSGKLFSTHKHAFAEKLILVPTLRADNKKKMPKVAQGDTHAQLREMVNIAAGKKVLLVLDDIWLDCTSSSPPSLDASVTIYEYPHTVPTIYDTNFGRDGTHESACSCLDSETDSKMLLTTRIKDILPECNE